MQGVISNGDPFLIVYMACFLVCDGFKPRLAMPKPSTSFPLFFILCLCVSPLTGLCQESDLLSDAAMADKIYLQTDGQVYTQGQTLWFKAIVVNASDHEPSRVSRVLYVELVNSMEEVHESKIINVEGGVGMGFFSFDEDLAPGLYMLRAYTEWNRNFGDGHYFKEYIHVYPKSAEYKAEPAIQNVVLEEKKGSKTFRAELQPLLLDKLHKRGLSVYLTLDGQKDSITLKPTGDLYELEYEVADESELLTVKLLTDNGQSYSQTFQVNKDTMDLQFFPEGGDLVDGLVSKVGFKAIGADGKGVVVEGDIVDQDRNVVGSFRSNGQGMGTFTVLASKESQYYGRTKAREGKMGRLYPLPQVKEKGAVLSVRKDKGNLELRISSTGLSSEVFTVEVGNRGLSDFVIERKPNDMGQLYLAIPEEDLPDGIVSIVLKDEEGSPLAHRLYFNEVLGRRLDIKVATDKTTYGQRDRSRLKSRIEDGDGNPVEASVSMMVINKNEMGEIQQGRHNILTYMLMGSELKGYIEKPAQYFDTNNPNRFADMDALMLTQGWSRYNYVPIELPEQVEHMPEQHLSISGTITGGLSGNRPLEGVQLTMSTLSDPPAFDMVESDSLGRFSTALTDIYDGFTGVVFKTKTKDKAKTFNLNLDRRSTPAMEFDHSKEIQKIDSVVYRLSLRQQELKLIEAAYDTTARDLGEVVVEDYYMTPLREEVSRKHGEPEVVVESTEMMEKKPQWSNRLFDLFIMQYPNYFRVNKLRTNPDGIYQGKVFDYLRIDGFEESLFMVDGEFVQPINYDLIPEIPVSELKSFEIIRQPGTFARNLLILFPDMEKNPFRIYAYLSIYTHSGKGIMGVRQPKGIYQEVIPVFSTAREFYVPKYEVLTPEDWVRPDYRALIHWSPNHYTDLKGEVETEFYNADLTGEMMVVVEAVSADGRIGYQEISYVVEKRKR